MNITLCLNSRSPEHSSRSTGKERDSETGLDYFGARYYGSNMGRFASTDPLNVPNLQHLKPKRFAHFISNPQNWNAYTYALNTPLSAVDPDGFLTIIISGTWSNLSDWEKSKFRQQVEKQFGEKAVILGWDRGDNKADRTAAANRLKALVAAHAFAEGEKLNIVAHSHGGNVAFEASKDISHKIDTLVTLGTPIRSDYVPNEANIGTHLNVFSPFDSVQTAGGSGSRSGNGEFGAAGRLLELPGVKNLESDYAKSHSELWTKPETWDKVVVPELKK